MHPPKTILLVEDNEDDIFFMERAIREAGIQNPIHVIRNGQELIQYLEGASLYADRSRFPYPSLVLLDLKLPLKSGIEVLQWKSSHPELAPTVFVVLSSSRENDDIERAYRYGTHSYLVKPPSSEKLLELVRALRLYWLEWNEFPAGAQGGVAPA